MPREGGHVRFYGRFLVLHIVLPGPARVGLGGQYATWAGTLLDRNHPIALITAPGRENEAALRLGRIGFDHVAGYLKGGAAGLESRPDLKVTTARLSAPFAAELLAAPEPPLVVDVRAPRERDQKRIAGSLSLPLNHLAENLEKLPPDRPLLLYCAGGYRSSIAASLLQARGLSTVSEIAGGIAAWEAANLPVETPRE